jgi:hypothetical protein
MPELSERHEVTLRGRDQTIRFTADSADGRLVISQEHDGKNTKEVCSVTLADPDELRAFLKGLQRILASLGYKAGDDDDEAVDAQRPPATRAMPSNSSRDDDREAVVEQARQRNPQAFAPWTKEEEEEIRRRHQGGENISAIARARKRSPRAIELRLQRLGVLPKEE